MGNMEKKMIKNTAIQISHCNWVIDACALENFIFKFTKLFGSVSLFSIIKGFYSINADEISLIELKSY